MSTIRGSAHSKYAGLLPIEPSDEPSPIRPASRENDWFQNGLSPRKRTLRALSFLIAFCSGVAATGAWLSYGDAARLMIESSYQQLSWLAAHGAITAQKTPDMVALDAVLRDFNAVPQSIDRTPASQEKTTRSIDQIATGIAAGQKLTRSTDETPSSTAQAPVTDATRITVESRADGASLQPTERSAIKPTEVRSPQTFSEKGKQPTAASGHESSCLPSATALRHNDQRAPPTGTVRASGRDGTICWYAATRPRGSDHRPRAVEITESGLPGPPARADSWP
jgi:hypothetical protein